MTDIQIIKTAYMTTKQVWTYLRKALDPSRANGPLLLLYEGHGAKDGWGISYCRRILYKALVNDLIKNYPEPILFINDCCYAAAPVKWFDEFDVSREKMSFIAAVNSQEQTDGGQLTERVQKSWRERKVHAPTIQRFVSLEPFKEEKRKTTEVRWGAELDHLFHSKLPQVPKKNPRRKTKPIVVTIPESWIIEGTPEKMERLVSGPPEPEVIEEVIAAVHEERRQ